MKVVVIMVLFGTFISSFRAVDAQQLYCPGQTVDILCRDPNVVTWEGTAFTGQCPNESDTITVTAAQAVVGSTTTCGIFIANVSDLTPSTVPGTNIAIVSLTFRADVSLNGTTVQCEDIDLQNTLEVDELLDIPATTTPTLMLGQNSQSMVGVVFVIDDLRCVAMYHVNVTQESGPTTSVSGSSSPVMVGGLDLCRYNYSFVGYTTSMTGEVSGVSASVDLTINLTAVNGVTVTVNQMDPVIQWNQTLNSLYPTCITGYMVSDQGNPSFNTTVDFNTILELTTEQLNAAGFPYCVTIQPTVTPMTLMGDLATVVGSSISLIDPAFPTPMLTYSFNLSVNNVVVLRVNIQGITGSLVETTTYNYTFNGSISTQMNFTGEYFEIELTGAEGGENVAVNVEFVYGQCMSSMAADFTVPGKSITDIIQGQPTDTSHNVTITLPLTPYQPEELLIISTLQPVSIAALVANFSRPAMQHLVTFDNLMADTSYNFTIRIVLRANTTVDVVSSATGYFMTIMTPTTTPPPTTMAPTTTSTQAPSQSTTAPLGGECAGGCIAGIIIGFLFVLVLVVVIIVIVVCYWSKTRKSGAMKVSSSHEMGQQSEKLTPSHGDQVDPVSAPPTETFKNADAADPPADKSPDVIPGNEDVDAGPDSATLIYADLDMATKGKNKVKVDATVTPTGGAEGHEAVEYASIEHFKKSDKSEGDEDN